MAPSGSSARSTTRTRPRLPGSESRPRPPVRPPPASPSPPNASACPADTSDWRRHTPRPFYAQGPFPQPAGRGLILGVTMADTATLAAPAKVLGPVAGRAGEILTPEALAFLAELPGRFDARRLELLAARAERQKRFDAGESPD